MPSQNEPKDERPLLRRVLFWTWRVLGTLLILSGLGMTGIALTIRHYEAGLPNTEQVKRYTPPQVTRILARDGTLLGEDFVERRTVVSIGEVPAHVKLAFLAAEDASFYDHEGLDYPGMLRAIWVNLRSQTSRQGASTITQQVVKNVLLTQDRTYERKIKEVILARRIEQTLTKDEILELYLNYIYFGHGRYGVEEASRYYFGKGVHDLSLGEAALLASVPKGPTHYSPREHLDRALERRKYVLDQIEAKHFLDPNAIAVARDEEVHIAPESEATPELAPEALAEVRRVLREVAGERAERGGFVVTTTIDPKLQASARKAVRDGLDGYDKRRKNVAPFKKPKNKPTFFEGDPTTEKAIAYVAEVTGADDAKNELFIRVGTVRGRVALSQAQRYNPNKLPASQFAEPGAPLRVSLLTPGKADADGKLKSALFKLEIGPQGALVALDVRTREILAMVGSYEGPRGGFDRATSAHRQPGSTFKSFVFGAALKSRKASPATLLPTDPAVLEGYRPKNYEKSGDLEPKRAREALAKSVNVSAAWLGSQVGPESVAELATSLGIESKLGATPSIALGAYEVSPREMANAYASIAAGGSYEEPRLVTKIVGPDGVEIPMVPLAPRVQAMTAAEAYVLTDMMKSVVKEGTGRAAQALRRPIAGKTGTSNEVRDAWFAGYSTEIACVVWTGYDDRTPLGAGESGGATALPAFVEFMRAAHQGVPPTDFPIPPGIERASIDPKTGLLAREGQEDAIAEIFLAGTEPKDTAPEPAGEGGGEPGTPPAEPSASPSAPPAESQKPPVEEPPPVLNNSEQQPNPKAG
jgi:penicillin-binding protein 1A